MREPDLLRDGEVKETSCSCAFFLGEWSDILKCDATALICAALRDKIAELPAVSTDT